MLQFRVVDRAIYGRAARYIDQTTGCWKNRWFSTDNAAQLEEPKKKKKATRPPWQRDRKGPAIGTTSISFDGKHVKLISNRTNIDSTHARLGKGLPVCINPGERYGGAVKVYSRIKNKLGERDDIDSFDEYQKYARVVQSTFKNMLLPLRPAGDKAEDGEADLPMLNLEGVPGPAVPSEWVKRKDYIPIREWFGLQNAARWFRDGVKYRQLNHKIHPLPGCYFAAPNSSWICAHYEAFDTWLRSGVLVDMSSAVDVGAGCGVLSCMMLRHGSPGFKVTAVDLNPAAVTTINRNSELLGFDDDGFGSPRLVAVEADLFPETLLPGKPDLIVFNPPWLPVEKDGEESISDHLIGLASYRDPDLMGRFLDGCFEQLAVGGYVCVIYSNYSRVLGKEDGPTPMELELENSSRFDLVSVSEAKVPVPKKVKMGKERAWKAEMITNLTTQLWVLRKKSSDTA